MNIAPRSSAGAAAGVAADAAFSHGSADGALSFTVISGSSKMLSEFNPSASTVGADATAASAGASKMLGTLADATGASKTLATGATAAPKTGRKGYWEEGFAVGQCKKYPTRPYTRAYWRATTVLQKI